MSTDVLVESHGGILTITIMREHRRNALTGSVISDISDALDRAEASPDIRAAILTGAGDKAFCSGADLRDGGMLAPDPSQPYGLGANLFRNARRLTVPLIARVNGACTAGGLGLLSMCDLAVASDKAIFGLPEVKVGVFPVQVLSLLQHLIPRRVLTEMCLMGEPLSAARALEIGLVNAVSSDLDGALSSMIERLLAGSPAAIRRGLYAMKKIEAMSFEESMSFTESQIALIGMTQDAREGRLAFTEKRKPNWAGK